MKKKNDCRVRSGIEKSAAAAHASAATSSKAEEALASAGAPGCFASEFALTFGRDEPPEAFEAVAPVPGRETHSDRMRCTSQCSSITKTLP